MSSWNECKSCDTEFQVLGGALDQTVEFCPFCGIDVESDEDEELEEDEE